MVRSYAPEDGHKEKKDEMESVVARIDVGGAAD